MELANATLSVLRGTAVNDWGDRTNVGTPLYTGIPAALVESSKRSFDRASQRFQTIRTITCMVPSWADILDTDTLLNEATGAAYMVEDITQQPSLGSPSDGLILTLRERSGVSVDSD